MLLDLHIQLVNLKLVFRSLSFHAVVQGSNLSILLLSKLLGFSQHACNLSLVSFVNALDYVLVFLFSSSHFIS